MADDGKITIGIEIDTKGMNGKDAEAKAKAIGKAISEAMNGAADTGKNAFSAFGDIFGKLASAGAVAFGAITAGVTAIGGGALAAYSSYEQLTGGVSKLFGAGGKDLDEYAQSIGKSTEEAKGQYNNLLGAQVTVLKNAQNAWQTAGMSANQYMTQVTSFSASLISSLGGDTKKAAEYADLAMTTMADNVNVYGSNMEDVQNAFQGFAKQNYTMLDNLKLGYGGTKSEMERLIKDANQLPGVMKDGNDLTIDSYADVIEAIARVQKAQGIAGTTANEAASTVEGSVNAMKAAWENWLIAIGTGGEVDLEETTQSLATAIGNVAQNIIPRVAIIGEAIAESLPGVVQQAFSTFAPLASEALAAAWNTVVTSFQGIGIQLPTVDASQITTGFQTAMQGIQDAFNSAAPFFETVGEKFNAAFGPLISGAIQELPGMISTIFGGIGETLGNIATTIEPLIGPLFSNIAGAMQGFWSVAGPILSVIGNILSAVLPPAIALVMAAVNATFSVLQPIFAILQATVVPVLTFLGNILATVLPVAITILTGVVMALGSFFTTIFTSMHQAIVDFVNGAVNFFTVTLPEGFNNFINAVGQIPGAVMGFLGGLLGSIAGWVGSMVNNAIQAGSQFLSNVVNYISQLPGQIGGFLSGVIGTVAGFVSDFIGKATEAASNFASNLINGLASIPGRVAEIGGQIVDGIANGIRNAAGTVVDAITGVVGGAIEAAKNFLGIHSPSTVMRDQVGRWMGAGIGVGIPIGFEKTDPYKGIMQEVSAQSRALRFQLAARSQSSQPVVVSQAAQPVNQTINFNQPVETPDLMARAWKRQQLYGLAGDF